MAFAFVNHHQKILQKIICLFQGNASLTKSGQIFSLDLIELFGVTYKQPDGHIDRIFLDALWMKRSSHLSLLERFQIAVDAPVRSGVALILDFLPKNQAIMFPILPAFESIGGKWVKRTLLFASFLGFGKSSLLEPVANRSITQPNTPRDLFRRDPLLAEFYHLL